MRDQIARDRAEKEAKAAAAKTSSQTLPSAITPTQSSDTATPATKKEYTTCKLQVYCPLL